MVVSRTSYNIVRSALFLDQNVVFSSKLLGKHKNSGLKLKLDFLNFFETLLADFRIAEAQSQTGIGNCEVLHDNRSETSESYDQIANPGRPWLDTPSMMQSLRPYGNDKFGPSDGL